MTDVGISVRPSMLDVMKGGHHIGTFERIHRLGEATAFAFVLPTDDPTTLTAAELRRIADELDALNAAVSS